MKPLKIRRDELGQRAYTSTDILRIGIKRERLKDWIERGLVNPSIQKARGQGTTHLFSIHDLYMIKLFERLVSRGISRIDAELRVGWLSKLIRGEEEQFWQDTRFLMFVKIAKEQGPILKRLGNSRLAGKLVREIDRLSEREYARVLGSFVPLPISDNRDVKQTDALFKCDEKWVCISREILNDGDDLVIVNVRKMREEIDSLVN